MPASSDPGSGVSNNIYTFELAAAEVITTFGPCAVRRRLLSVWKKNISVQNDFNDR